MTRMIQVWNVPDGLHRTLKARAAMAGMSLSDYLLAELRRMAGRPTPEEMRTRLAGRLPVVPKEPVARAVRAGRERR